MAERNVPFCFPLSTLENSRLKLVPFNINSHGAAYIEAVKDEPHLFKYLPFGPCTSVEELGKFLNSTIYPYSNRCWLAVIIKSSAAEENGTFAGTIGYLNADPANCKIEVGYITIFTQFQGKGIAKVATGLLIAYAMDAPPTGLGLRRCVWQAHAANEVSKSLALKTLFTYEGTQRFERLMPDHKQGNGYDTSSMPDVFGRKMTHSRDTAVFAHYCDEWAKKRPMLMSVIGS